MKATGPTKLSTLALIRKLENLGKKNKQAIWLDIAKRLGKPRRIGISVNLWKLNKMAARFPGKILLVPGKVLSHGSLGGALTICALEFSAGAAKKISLGRGKALPLSELVEKPNKPSEIIIIK